MINIAKTDKVIIKYLYMWSLLAENKLKVKKRRVECGRRRRRCQQKLQNMANTKRTTCPYQRHLQACMATIYLLPVQQPSECRLHCVWTWSRNMWSFQTEFCISWTSITVKTSHCYEIICKTRHQTLQSYQNYSL